MQLNAYGLKTPNQPNKNPNHQVEYNQSWALVPQQSNAVAQ